MTLWMPLLGALALAADGGVEKDKGPPWETVQTSPLVIKSRPRPGTGVKEVWAEGDLSAPVVDIQTALTDVTRFAKYMPYIAEARQIDDDADGGHYMYAKVELPFFLSSRDYVHCFNVDRDARTDPEGVFANHWFAAPTRLPERHGVVRLKLSEGSWLVTPKADGKAHIVYHVAADPGGMIPGFAANMGSTQGIEEQFKAVEKEALYRKSLRLKDGGQ